MRTRLKDVAAKLNLSPAVVSGVLNNRPHIWASEETRLRILAAAKELNYRPSAVAQALSRGTTDSIAFVYRRLGNSAYRLAYSGLMDALSTELQRAGYDLNVANFGTQEEVLVHLEKLATSRACDAVVLWGREADTEPQGDLLEKLGFPFVVKGRHETSHPRWFQIDFDHERMIHNAVHHLQKLGHTRLAYLGFPHDEGFVRGLRTGFEQAHLASFGRSPNPLWIGEFPDEVEPNSIQICRWLEDGPTAFVMAAGNGAWQALEMCLAERGCRLSDLPESYSAAGITSSPFHLMFGDAKVYREISIDHLAPYVVPALVNAIDRSEDAHRVFRFCPNLTEGESLRITVNRPLSTARDGAAGA